MIDFKKIKVGDKIVDSVFNKEWTVIDIVNGEFVIKSGVIVTSISASKQSGFELLESNANNDGEKAYSNIEFRFLRMNLSS